MLIKCQWLILEFIFLNQPNPHLRFWSVHFLCFSFENTELTLTMNLAVIHQHLYFMQSGAFSLAYKRRCLTSFKRVIDSINFCGS